MIEHIEPKATADGVAVYCAHDKIVDTDSLVGNPRNPNKHPKEQITALAKIIKRQGWRHPIVVSNRSGFVVKGHGRLLAAKEIGAKQVPVDFQDYESEASEYADLMADNKIQEFSELDMKMSADILQDIKDSGDIELEMSATAPPYNVAYEGTAGTIQNDSMEDGKFYEFLFSAFKCMYDVCADGASIYVFHADKESINFRTAFRDAGFFCHQTCIWVKNTPVLGRCDYQYCHEPILVGWKPTAGHKWYSDRKQRTVWNFDKPKKSELHPTTKPIPLVAYPIQNSSVVNSVILEPFGGSGSTLIACEQTDRICYAIEIDEKFVDVIVRRYVDFKENSDDVFLLRNGEKIPYSEVLTNE